MNRETKRGNQAILGLVVQEEHVNDKKYSDKLPYNSTELSGHRNRSHQRITLSFVWGGI